MYETLKSPIDYGGVLLKNRILFAPTSLGMPPHEAIERLHAIAAGGCAMIIVGDVSTSKRGFGLSLASKRGFAYYRRLADAVHGEGCKLCAQLYRSDMDMKAMARHLPALLSKKITAQQLRALCNEAAGAYITSLSADTVRELTASFGDAAELAQQAGFDLVQIHGDRMCGSFSSSLYNRRQDAYGGPLENRARFAVEAVRAVRRRLPHIPIDFKLVVRLENPHYGNAGVTPEELPRFVPLLEQAGVTSFHVTLANHSNLADTIPPTTHPAFGAEGCFLPFCDAVRRVTSLPVCGVGGLCSPDFIERQLSAGRIDCAAMSRQLIADPQWMNKILSGRPETIHRCVRCNRECLGGIQAHRGVHCIYEKGKEK